MNSSRLQFYGLREFIQTHMGKLIAKEVVIPLKKKKKTLKTNKKQLIILLPHNPAIELLGIYPNELKNYILTKLNINV